MERDFYQVLGVAHDASPAAIRAAYTRLARRHHPDVSGDLPQRLHDVQQAYRCLSDDVRRAEHDRLIAAIERSHAARQRRVQHRLYGYDRRHPALRRRGARPWLVVLGLVVLAVAATVAAGLLAKLPG